MNVLNGMTMWCGPLDDKARRRGRTAALGAVTAVALAATLAACSPGEADAEPGSGGTASTAVSESPSASAGSDGQESSEPDDPQAIIEQRTADAIERYKEYVQIKNEFEQRGENAFAELSKGGYLGSHDAREYEKKYGAELEKHDRKQTGEFVLSSLESVEYDGDPREDFDGHEVQLETCIDASGVDFVDGNGEKVPGDRADELAAEVTMRGTRINVGGEPKYVWSVSLEHVTAEEC